MIRNTWEKIESRIDKSGEHWFWTGSMTFDGYGIVVIDNKKWRVHRLVYLKLVGPIPKGYDIDHIQEGGLCGIRICCKPEHLRAVTHRENIKGSTNHVAARMDLTHCSKGHKFTKKNTIRRQNGTRLCRTCKNARERARRAELKAAA